MLLLHNEDKEEQQKIVEARLDNIVTKVSIFKSGVLKYQKYISNYIHDNNIMDIYKETLNLFNDSEIVKFSLKNELFKNLYALAEVIEEGDFYQAKKSFFGPD